MKFRRCWTTLVVAAFLPSPGLAQETITYRYDSRGRLVKVERSGSVNAGVVSTYAYDRANNRTGATVTGSSGTGLADAGATLGTPVLAVDQPVRLASAAPGTPSAVSASTATGAAPP